MISDGKSVTLNDVEAFSKDLRELTEIEIDLGLHKIRFDLDKEPVCTVEEMSLLMPLIEVKSDFNAQFFHMPPIPFSASSIR